MDSSKAENKKTARSLPVRILLWFLLLLFIAATGFGIWFYIRYGRDLLECRTRAHVLAARATKNDFMSEQTSICYYSDGTVMQKLAGSKNVYYLPYSAIPENAENAVLAVEDRKFYSHKGYDVYAILRAARAYIENDGRIKQGGSTITQQLARTVYLTGEKTIERKATEIFLAAALEQKFSKHDIMEFYLNNIYFANGYYGIQAAAKGYFGLTASDLTLSQTAFLCGIPNSPSAYDPRAHFDKTIERRDSVLRQMYENGYISKTDYSAALNEEIVLVTSEEKTNNYEETFTFRCAIHALMQAEGFVIRNTFDDQEDKDLYEEFYYEEYSRVWRNLYAKGYRIYTSINPVKQELLQAAIDSGTEEFSETNENGIYKIQAAGACIDNDTGFVVAIVGGRSQETVGYTLNRAFQSPRQPGSSIKPLIVYTPAFEMGYYPDTIVVDEKFEGGPANSGGVYLGEIDVRYAVAVSKNTVAWNLLQEIGVKKGLSYLLKMNFSSITDTDYYPAAALGGLTYGATAVEMASAYAAIENDGIYRTPTCILRITDTGGNEVVDNVSAVTIAAKTAESKKIYEKNAARMMTDVLTSVMTSGTGRKMALSGMTSAGKTGTTKNQKDGWFAGYTRYYTTAVWFGADMPRTIDDLMGNTYPGQIWHSFMEAIHDGLEDRSFEPYIDNRPQPAEEPEELDEYPAGWVDNDGDGIPDGYAPGWTDTDGDGEPDIFTPGWIDTDEDGIPDTYLSFENVTGETDSDGDGVMDGFAPGWEDTDGDGQPDTYTPPEENTVVVTDGWADTDGDGIPDSYPYGWIDTDEDGIPDAYPPDLPDTDGNGIPDTYDDGGVIWVKPDNGVEWVDPRNR